VSGNIHNNIKEIKEMKTIVGEIVTGAFSDLRGAFPRN